MKRKVRLTHTVELVIEGKSEDRIYDFIQTHTPSEVKKLVNSSCGDVEESYDEEILDGFSEDDFVKADYVIE